MTHTPNAYPNFKHYLLKRAAYPYQLCIGKSARNNINTYIHYTYIHTHQFVSTCSSCAYIKTYTNTSINAYIPVRSCLLLCVHEYIHKYIHTYIHACMHIYIIHTFQVFRSFALAFVACIYTHDILRASSKKQSIVSFHYCFPSIAPSPDFQSGVLFCFCFCFVFVAFVFPFFLFRNYWSAFVDHAKKSSSRLSNPALYKEPNRQETREAQDRSTESNRLRAKSQETKKKRE
jgi:hypothetical protein